MNENLPRRKPTYLSPSSLAKFEENPSEYYLHYLSPVRPPKIDQSRPMSVGSAFDAHVKSYLHQRIYGKGHPESSKYDLEALLCAQVEPQNLDWARDAGKYVFDKYQESGALADLMLELDKAVDEPRFEFQVSGVIDGYREGITAQKMGVPLLGKPDLRFINSEGAHVIYDWKVNGFLARGNTSPQAGYIELLDGGKGWMRCGPHKDAFITRFKGLFLNSGSYFDMYDPAWATQLTTYCWLLGEQVGAETIIGVDQIVCNGAKPVLDKDRVIRPTLRIARHRSRISEDFQFRTIARYQALWSILNEPELYLFRDVSFEESKMRCDVLDKQAEAMCNPDSTSDDSWIFGVGRE